MLYFLWFIKGVYYYIEYWQKCLLRELILINGVIEKIFFFVLYLIISWGQKYINNFIDSVVSILDSMYFFI